MLIGASRSSHEDGGDDSTDDDDPGPRHPAAQKSGAPHKHRLALTLQSVRVNSLNDDDTPNDETYLGLLTAPGPPLLVRIPGNAHWLFARSQRTAALQSSVWAGQMACWLKR